MSEPVPTEDVHPRYRRRTTKTAVLVIHGIGEQSPYETLDGFARGLCDYFRRVWALDPKLEPRRIRHKDWTEVSLNLDLNHAPAEYPGPRWVSIYEFYWAPYTQDKIKYSASMGWLIRTTLSPLRQLCTNLQEMVSAKRTLTWKDVPVVFLRELWRILLLYIPLLFALGALFFWIAKPLSLSGLREAASSATSMSFAWPTAAFIAAAAMTVVLAVSVLGFLRDLFRRSGPTMQKRADVTWLLLATGFLFLFGWLTWFLSRASQGFLTAVGDLVDRFTLLKVVATAGLVWLVRRVLVHYVGDVAIYVSTDEKSKGFEARSKILAEASASLTDILTDRERRFDQVVLAGHSLGSVIAYDAINRIVGQTWAADHSPGGQPHGPTTDELQKLKGLITFGSPLDKIYYFFRQQVRADQSVRAQIISFLHPFRRARSGRDYGKYLFTYRDKPALDEADRSFAFPKFKDFRWVNVWSVADPISGRLNFYEVDEQLHRMYAVPLVAHLSYWDDPGFYEFFADQLLFERG